MSKFKLADTMQISINDAEKIIDAFFAVVPKVKAFLDGVGDLGKLRKYIRSAVPYSRYRFFDCPNEHHKDYFKRLGEIERASKNHPMQGYKIRPWVNSVNSVNAEMPIPS